MREKLTLAKFRELKEQYFAAIKQFEISSEEHKELYESDNEQFIREYGADVLKICQELISYDLSDIPFEEWENVSLVSLDSPLDLSATHANIDFRVIDSIESPYGVNLKGCNIRNVEYAYSNLLRDNFDEQIVKEHPDLFLSSLFDREFEKKYVTSTLEISDLLNLSDEQLNELSAKKRNSILNYQSNDNRLLTNISDYLGLTKSVKVYKINPEYINELSIVINNIKYSNFGQEINKEQIMEILKIEPIPLMMDRVDEYIAQLVTSTSYLDIYNFSNRFRNKYPNLFISKDELPEDVYERFTHNQLTLADYVNHYNVFGKGNFLNHLNHSLQDIKNLIGAENFLAIINEAPFLFTNNFLPFDIGQDFDFYSSLNKKINSARENNEIYNIKDLFYLTIVQRYYNNDNLTFVKTNDPSVFDSASYPEWLQKLGIYLESTNILSDEYIPLITSETFLNVSDKRLIEALGLKNLIRFAKEYGPLGDNLNVFARYYTYNVEEPPATYEEFLNRLTNLFITSIRTQYYNNKVKAIETVPDLFKKEHPEIFLSSDAPEDLKNLYYANNLSFQQMRMNPEWQNYLKNVDLRNIFANACPVISTPDKYMNLTDYLYSIGAKDKMIEYILSYGNLLNGLSININSFNDLNLAELDNLITEKIHDTLIEKLKQSWSVFDSIYDENLPASFKQLYPELFLSSDAPSDLKSYFYAGSLTLKNINNHPEWLPYLEGKTAFNIRDIPQNITAIDSESSANLPDSNFNLTEIYIKNYGLKSYLDFLLPYSSVINLFKKLNVDLKDTSKEGIESSIEQGLYNVIVNNAFSFAEDFPESFKQKYPDIFLSSNAPQELKDKYYARTLNYSDFYHYPEYYTYLQHIKFSLAFKGVRITNNYLNFIPDDIAYQLITTFGNYIAEDSKVLDSLKDLKTLDQATILNIKDQLINLIKNGQITYDEDVPQFIKQEIPHMFLASNAPDDLKKYYYKNVNYSISFTVLKAHPEWLPFLQNKSILPFYYNTPRIREKELIEFIDHIGGEQQFLKLGLQKPKDVDYMISHNKLDLLEKWYLKTGKKFIPDYVVMETLPFADADKFLAHGKSWSLLMRSGNYRNTPEGVDALIKLAYSFGIFEGDSQAEKRLISIISNLPRNLNSTDQNTIFQMEETILKSFTNPEENRNNMLIGLPEYKKLREVMQKEGFSNAENQPVLPFIFRANENNQYHLILNEQQYPETAKWVRNFMEANNVRGMITPQIAHSLFGSFTLKYDRDFREFLLKNLDEILDNPEYMTYVAAIQKQFDRIKIDNSNRVLTLKLAVDYVQSNKYSNVETGNEDLSRVSAIAGYSQAEFDILQQIFNYGKLRTFSSIPRISSSKDEYTYEIPRLMDAFPIAAGTLSDCCQEIDNWAELDMEHSMTSKHGRLFVIRDEHGKIAAQSWVWRNQNLLCFDNIEVPDKAFERAIQEKHLTKEQFAQIIFDIYVKAAEELIAADEQVYRQLLEEGKITEEQYNSLKLSKITVGLGHNDIATAINKNAIKDQAQPKLPPKYEAPVPLKKELYLTDSRMQYILSEKEGHIKPTDSETLSIHYDEYEEYNKDNIDYTAIKTLKHLEIASSKRENYQLNCNIEDEENAFSELAYNYGVREEGLRLIITPNFAIIYEETPTNINILDLLANTQVNLSNEVKDVSKEVYLQMKLAFLQLLNKGKKIDTSRMLTDVTSLYNDIDSLNTDFTKERGISHGAK